MAEVETHDARWGWGWVGTSGPSPHLAGFQILQFFKGSQSSDTNPPKEMCSPPLLS